jgi:hypothetical protein
MRFVALLALLLLASCLSPEQRADLHEKAQAPIYCDDAADCAVKWHKAYRWIEDNSHYEIGKATDTEIVTRSVDDATYAGMHARKLPQEDGTYKITFDATCSNMLGCFPDPVKLEAAFYTFVTTPDDAPAEENDTELGLTFAPVDPARMGNQLVITAVVPGSPAAKAGLHAGDKLLQFNGRIVTSVEQLNELTATTPTGSVVTIEVQKSGQTKMMYMRV